jgi:hypothetical protein
MYHSKNVHTVGSLPVQTTDEHLAIKKKQPQVSEMSLLGQWHPIKCASPSSRKRRAAWKFGNLLAMAREQMLSHEWKKWKTIMAKSILAKTGWQDAAFHGLMECVRESFAILSTLP